MPRKTTPAAQRPATWTRALTRFADHLVDQEKSDHTQKNYREDLLAFTDWYQQTYQERPDLGALAPSELREWKAHLRDDLKLEPATVNRKLAALRSFLAWAAAEGLAAELVTPRSIKQVKPPPRWLDRRQQRAWSAPSSATAWPATSPWSRSCSTPGCGSPSWPTCGGPTWRSATGRAS